MNAQPVTNSNGTDGSKGTRGHGSGGASNRQRWLMRFLAATFVPLLILGTLEVGLRIAGYGYPTQCLLASRIGGQDFLIPNYKFSYRFFPPSLARKPALYRLAVTMSGTLSPSRSATATLAAKSPTGNFWPGKSASEAALLATARAPVQLISRNRGALDQVRAKERNTGTSEEAN